MLVECSVLYNLKRYVFQRNEIIVLEEDGYEKNSPEKEEIIQKTLENSKQQRDLIEENYERLWMDIEEVLFMNKLNQISELSMSEE